MADAWTTLKENSSLITGDAWEHLLAQVGGSGGDRYPAYLSNISFGAPVAGIAAVMVRSASAVAGIGNVKKVMMIRFPALIVSIKSGAGRYPAPINTISCSGVHGVAGLSNIRI